MDKLLPYVPKVWGEVEKRLEKDRAEKERNWRDFGDERATGKDAMFEADRLLKELKKKSEREKDESKDLTREVREQGRRLKEMADERRKELRALEKSIARVDGLLEGLESRVLPGAGAIAPTPAFGLLL